MLETKPSPETQCAQLIGALVEGQTLTSTECAQTGSLDVRLVQDCAQKALVYCEQLGVYVLQSQAAGHANIFFKEEADSPWLFKAMFPRELQFNSAMRKADLNEQEEQEVIQPWVEDCYANSIDQETLRRDLAALARYSPCFSGKVRHLPAENSSLAEVCFAALKDITCSYAKPCVMDIKLGSSSVVLTQDLQGQEKAHAKDSIYTTATLGFRIQGMRCYAVESQAWLCLKKEWVSPSKDAGKAKALFKLFAGQGNGATERTANLARELVTQISELGEVLAKQESFALTGTSLLMLYDGAPDTDLKAKVYLIDFAEVFPWARGAQGSEVPDNGVCDGLANIKRLLSED